jgi:hypothetical protein
LDNETIRNLKELLDSATLAPTKKDAKVPLRQLEFAAARVRGDVDSYPYQKLSEAIDYASAASGQVKNKEHWIECMESSWYVFEGHARK